MAIPPAYVYRALRRYASKVGWPVMYVYVPDWATYVRACLRLTRRGAFASRVVMEAWRSSPFSRRTRLKKG